MHGSALNTSDAPRNLLLYESPPPTPGRSSACADLAEFDGRMIGGDPTILPRMETVPVRMPFPPALHQGSIYENQTVAMNAYFNRAA